MISISSLNHIANINNLSQQPVLEKIYDIDELIKSNQSHNFMAIVERIWERIKDFFCGTHVVEVKKILFDLYSGNVDDASQVIERLNTLNGHNHLFNLATNITVCDSNIIEYKSYSFSIGAEQAFPLELLEAKVKHQDNITLVNEMLGNILSHNIGEKDNPAIIDTKYRIFGKEVAEEKIGGYLSGEPLRIMKKTMGYMSMIENRRLFDVLDPCHYSKCSESLFDAGQYKLACHVEKNNGSLDMQFSLTKYATREPVYYSSRRSQFDITIDKNGGFVIKNICDVFKRYIPDSSNCD